MNIFCWCICCASDFRVNAVMESGLKSPSFDRHSDDENDLVESNSVATVFRRCVLVCVAPEGSPLQGMH